MDTGALVTDDPVAFARALPEGGVLLGIDLGTVTVGMALCDAGWRFATAARSEPRKKFAAIAATVRGILDERQGVGIVVGLPRNMDGSETARAQASRSFAHSIAVATGRPALLWDERWSTVSAERDMIATDTSRAKRATRIDAHAAAVILQGAIDRMSGGAW